MLMMFFSIQLKKRAPDQSVDCLQYAVSLRYVSAGKESTSGCVVKSRRVICKPFQHKSPERVMLSTIFTESFPAQHGRALSWDPLPAPAIRDVLMVSLISPSVRLWCQNYGVSTLSHAPPARLSWTRCPLGFVTCDWPDCASLRKQSANQQSGSPCFYSSPGEKQERGDGFGVWNHRSIFF